jgi:cytochrome P450
MTYLRAVAAPFDPADPAFLADPYPTYAHLRREEPVRWDPVQGLWLVARHADVDRVLRDRRFGRVFTPREPAERFEPWNLVNRHAMLELEPPDHTRLRKLVAHEFTPRFTERLRPRVRALVAELLDALEHDEEPDLVGGLAEPLPVAVIAELLGFPAEDRHRLRPWSAAIVALYELAPPPGAEERAIAAAAEFTEYLRALVARRRREPGDDLLSALAVLSLEGDRLSEAELIATAVLLLNAGHEASVNVLANGVVALLRNPDQQQRLVDEPGLIAGAVEEAIRYDTPLSLFQRTAFSDVAVAGVTVAAGQRVGLLLGSANRDEAVFADADTFDVGRRPNPHVGFGAGIHYCLGAPLARLELQEALGGLLQRWPDLALAAEPPRRPTYQFRGYLRLPVTRR